ncbi:porin [Herbaspirillum camelliae]|uniref:porin n=1 Tax=Herbaspirillum camelliae TaxID=1892903 RepID=UPI000949D196|nr:porin [Herbaspirillum camelliae]
MKNSRILCAIALVSVVVAGHAFAQSAVTVYGIIDTGVVYTSNANANGNSVMKMPSLTGTFPSRIGFKGVEDLGSGLQTIFVAETGFAPDTGAMGQGNRIFGRQSYVGLKGAWGQIMLGRQVNMTYLAPLKSDVMGPNIFSIGSIDGYLPNARSDNAIGYLGAFGSFTAGATYSFGRDAAGTGGPAATNCPGEVAGNAKACRQFTGLLAYETKAYGINSSYDILYGNAGAAGGLTSSDNCEQRVTVNGYWMLGDIKVGGGIVDHRIRAASNLYKDSDLYYLGMSYPFSAALVLDAQLARLNTKGSSNDVTLSVARLTYSLSKRTAVYSSLGYIKNGGTSAVSLDAGGTVGAGKNQLGLMTGVRHTF